MSTRTIYLARLIGLTVLLGAVGLLVQGNALIMATVANGPVMFAYAIFASRRSQSYLGTTSGPAVRYR
jgi:hypothetical protein